MKVKIKWVLFTEESPKPHKQLLVWYHYNSMNPEPKIASYIGDGVFIGPAGHKLYYMDISHWSYFDVPEPKGKAND